MTLNELAHYTGVDFNLRRVVHFPTEEYLAQLNSGTIDEATLNRYASERLNVFRESRFQLVARKPAFGVA